jgi:autophagy-related protein 16
VDDPVFGGIFYDPIQFFQDKKIRFWDTRTSSTEPLSEINMAGKVTSLDLARNGQSLLACLRDDTLRLIDLR